MNGNEILDKIKNLSNNVIFIIGFFLILILFLLSIFTEIDFFSNGILSITALIVLWYTLETSQIRRAQQETAEVSKASLLRLNRPAIGYSIFTNMIKPYDTRIRLVNLSDIAVAIKLHCNFKVDGEVIRNFLPAYEGKDYWNLQLKQAIEGHFSILDLYLKKDLISEEEIQNIKEAGKPEGIRKQFYKSFVFKSNTPDPGTPPEISMDIEIYCCNDKKQEAYYPPVHYKFDSFKMTWIPTVTNQKPYWDFEDKPNWIKPNVQ